MTTPRVKTHLFPYNNSEFPVVVVAQNFDSGDNTQSRNNYYLQNDRSIPTRMALFVSDTFTPRVLPNGYYFEEKTIKHIEDDTLTHVTQTLDPALSTCSLQNDHLMQLVCGSKDKKKIYAFDGRYANLLLKQSNPTFKQKNGKYFGPIDGDLVYEVESKEESITSVVAFPDPANHLIAIALNTGEIKIGMLKVWDNNKFWMDKQLVSPSASFDKNTELFVANNGMLISHVVGENVFHTWDLYNNFKHNEYPCPKEYKFKMSGCGEYLSSMEDQGHDTSNVVHLFDTHSHLQHKFELKKPISDFVIGGNNKVCYIVDSSICQSSLSEFLQNYDKESLKKPSASSIGLFTQKNPLMIKPIKQEPVPTSSLAR